MSIPSQSNSGIKSALAIATILLLIPACIWGYKVLSKSPINGKVLIVQRDAEVKKLALIELYAISAKDVAKWKAVINENLRLSVEGIRSFQSEASLAETEIHHIWEKRVANSVECIAGTKEAAECARQIWLIERKSEVLRKRLLELLTKVQIPGSQEIIELAKRENWQDAYAQLAGSSVPEAERINRLALSDYSKQLTAHRDATRKKLLALRASLDDLIPAPTVKALPSDIEIHAKDITDDTGSFVLNVLPGDYLIFAEGSRAVSSKTEHYFWAHPIKVPSQESQKCLIGNLNLNGESTIKDDLWHELKLAIAAQKNSLNP